MSFSPKNTKILYLTDSYARKVAGIKISLFNEMKSRGFDIVEQNIHTAGTNRIDGKKLLQDLSIGGYTHLWVAHTWVTYVGCSLSDINKKNVTVLGFGFSDPYEWDPKRLNQYNLYATHSRKLSDSIKDKPTVYFTTCCDRTFHKDLNLPRTIDIVFIGCGVHPRFKNKKQRITIMKKIIDRFPNTKIFGRSWPGVPSQGPIFGERFLEVINSSKLSIDIEEAFSPLAHRNFEFPACGTPIITRKRPDVDRLHGPFPTYADVNDLVVWLDKMLKDPQYYKKCRDRMYKEVTTKHTIKNRVDKLLTWLACV